MNAEDPVREAFESRPSRYVVGIDLGTTNSAVAYIDMQSSDRAIRDFAIAQWVDFAAHERRDVLPSFHYALSAEEQATFAKNGKKLAGTLPSSAVVGCLARDRGFEQPGRQIASAKSWLCHDGVDRQAPLLPWHSDADVEKISPVDASARILTHIRDAWDGDHRAEPLAEQDVILTLPASFDEVARQLTVESARRAGLPRIVLIEEPQAAFYAWLYRHRAHWETLVQSGQSILVCDIGGGTTDFTLIRVRSIDRGSAENETLHAKDRSILSLHRVAVGQHLILGGDNLDLALAKLAESKLGGGRVLLPRAWEVLRQSCRTAKETLLGSSTHSHFTLNLPGSGSKLVGGGTRIELTAGEVRSALIDGFFPFVDINDRPVSQPSGFQEFGLPYASDPAITRHLAAFLMDHRFFGRSESECERISDLCAAMPDFVLFNGGVLASDQVRLRIVDQIAQWFAGCDPGIAADWRPKVLDHDRLELAVARGAAYFGLVRRGEGVRIEAKLARSFYLLVDDDPPTALCIVPGSASLGDRFCLAQTQCELSLGEPVQFSILSSSTRLADEPGAAAEIVPEHFVTLPPIRTVLQWSGRKRTERIPVILETLVSEIGTLQLWCASADGRNRWQLDFDIRSATVTDRPKDTENYSALATVEQSIRDTARRTLEEVFGTGRSIAPALVTQVLAERLRMARQSWPPSLLRSMWQDLIELQEGCKASPQHEARWLNLLGFCLRPGYGVAADDWRVGQTWRAVYGKLAFGAASSRNECLILWRRIAGGFTAGQQMAVYQQVAGPLRSVLDPAKRAKGSAACSPNEFDELLRLVGSLELLSNREKSQLGAWLIELSAAKKWVSSQSAIFWTIGRIGSREPIYGPLNVVVEVDEVTKWLQRLFQLHERNSPALDLAIMQCARLTGDRYRDIDSDLRSKSIQRLNSAPDHYRALVERGGSLAKEESTEILGELLPLGLRVLR